MTAASQGLHQQEAGARNQNQESDPGTAMWAMGFLTAELIPCSLSVCVRFSFLPF